MFQENIITTYIIVISIPFSPIIRPFIMGISDVCLLWRVHGGASLLNYYMRYTKSLFH